MRNGRPIVNALTVDLEDYFHVTAFEGRVSRRSWDDFPSRVVANTERLLEVFDAHQVRATFFALGWIAERFPSLMRTIADAGHELGCHSYWHRLVYQMTPAEFVDDVRQARSAIESAIGSRVVAYRAPSWSITARSLWALELLAGEGFSYDSSIFPIYHDRYGIPGANPFPHALSDNAEPLLEFPSSVVRVGGFNIPVSGGGYFRLYPFSWTKRFLRRINDRLGEPFMFYIHPWELDPDQPRVSSRWRAWRHYVNLSSTTSKLDRLLRQFRFGRMGDVLDEYFAVRVKQPRLRYVPSASNVTECA
jgi:polysaccharide deacetylase family protein (PEP-CTERM system associated)